MAINCWALNRATSVKTVGLCHSIPHTANELARNIDVPVEEISYLVAGINHMAFYLSFEREVNGQVEDLYPRIYQVISDGQVPKENRVRYDLLKRFGYFVTESSEHISEYVPWLIRYCRPDLVDRYNIPLDEYLHRCEKQINDWESLKQELIEYQHSFHLEPSGEYGALVIHSIEADIPRVVYSNVVNEGLISNLPADCIVEVPCLVDGNGIQPTHIGELPPQLAALMHTNINVQRLTVEAALTKKREHIYHAAMLDPHTGAELEPDQIWSLVDDLIDAHGDWLPKYM